MDPCFPEPCMRLASSVASPDAPHCGPLCQRRRATNDRPRILLVPLPALGLRFSPRHLFRAPKTTVDCSLVISASRGIPPKKIGELFGCTHRMAAPKCKSAQLLYIRTYISHYWYRENRPTSAAMLYINVI